MFRHLFTQNAWRLYLPGIYDLRNIYIMRIAGHCVIPFLVQGRVDKMIFIHLRDIKSLTFERQARFLETGIAGFGEIRSQAGCSDLIDITARFRSAYLMGCLMFFTQKESVKAPLASTNSRV